MGNSEAVDPGTGAPQTRAEVAAMRFRPGSGDLPQQIARLREYAEAYGWFIRSGRRYEDNIFGWYLPWESLERQLSQPPGVCDECPQQRNRLVVLGPGGHAGQEMYVYQQCPDGHTRPTRRQFPVADWVTDGDAWALDPDFVAENERG